jgi:hypothetical protein
MTNPGPIEALERAIKAAMSKHLQWDLADTTIRTGSSIRRLVGDEDHANDVVIYTDLTCAIASVDDPLGFEGACLNAWDDDLQVFWDRVADDVGKFLKLSVSAELWETQATVLLMEE